MKISSPSTALGALAAATRQLTLCRTLPARKRAIAQTSGSIASTSAAEREEAQ